MEIPAKLQEVLKKDGVVAIATLGEDGPHLVNTWNSYVRLTPDGRLLIPAGYMNQTEANVAFNPEVLITAGSRQGARQERPGHGLSHRGHGGLRHLGPRVRHAQGDLRLDARDNGRHCSNRDPDALARRGRRAHPRRPAALLKLR